MHELPIVIGLLDTMEQEAKTNHFARIKQIDLTVGELSGIVNECISLYMEEASVGTVCENVKLAFTTEKATLQCSSCGHTFPHDDGFQCPVCGKEAVLVKGTGTDCVIERYYGEE